MTYIPPEKIHHRTFDSQHERRKNRRHRERHREHRHNPCPHRPRQLDADSEIYGEFQRHPHPFSGTATTDQTKKLQKGRKRHNGWVARLRWEEVDTDSDGFPINVVRYQIEVELSADATDWFFASRHSVPAKDDCDPGDADHIVIHHIHGNLAYRFRVRAIGNNCKADWSDYYVLGVPDDGPPAPFDVQIKRASHGIGLRWHAEPAKADDELFSEDIAYFVAEIWTNPDFGPVRDFTATASDDKFHVTAHGFDDGDPVMISGTDGGPTLPDGAHPWKVYRVDSKTADTFKLVTFESLANVSLTTDGDGVVHWGLVRKKRHIHHHKHRFRFDALDFDEDTRFYGRVRSVSDHGSKSAQIPATNSDPGNDDPDAAPDGLRPAWHRHVFTFTILGDVVEGLYNVPDRVDDDYRIRRVTGAFHHPPTGAAHFDIKVNGSTFVFDENSSFWMTIPDGGHDGSSKQIQNGTLERGDMLRVKCEGLGSDPPANGTIQVICDRVTDGSTTDSGGGGGE